MGNKPPGRKFAESCRSSSENFRFMEPKKTTCISFRWWRTPPTHHPLTCGEPGSLGHLFDRLETRLVDMNQVAKKMGNSFVFPEIVSRNNKSIGRSLLLKEMSLGLTGYIQKKQIFTRFHMNLHIFAVWCPFFQYTNFAPKKKQNPTPLHALSVMPIAHPSHHIVSTTALPSTLAHRA